MKKINPSYFQIVIVALLFIIAALSYHVVQKNIEYQKAEHDLDKYYHNVVRAYDRGDIESSKVQLNSAIESMKAIASKMDELSNKKINQSIDELLLLQKSIDKNIVTSDVIKVILSRSLNVVAFGEVQLAQKEIYQNNINKGIYSLDCAKTHLLANNSFLNISKKDPNEEMIGQISSLVTSLKKNEEYLAKLDLLQDKSILLIEGIH